MIAEELTQLSGKHSYLYGPEQWIAENTETCRSYYPEVLNYR